MARKIITPRWRELLPGQRSQLRAIDVDTGEDRLVFESDRLVLEAPNWTPDGRWLICNAAGLLYRVAADGSGSIDRIDAGWLDDVNNDHLVSRDGSRLYVSSEGDGQLYSLPMGGGRPRRITEPHPEPFAHFVLGESFDGTTLHYTGCAVVDGAYSWSNLYSIPVTGEPDIQLTDWPLHSVGSDPSPDGWLYFTSEYGSVAPGHTQIFRMRADGSGRERLTDDERVNWFPKVSPDGRRLVFLSFPPGTVGHEENVEVRIRSMDPDGACPRDILSLFGGQGTLNVNSWASDSRHFAYAAYPVEVDGTIDRRSTDAEPE